MADAFVILPDDSGNVGKKVRTQTRTVAGNEVHEHMFNLVDPLPAGTNNIGDVDVLSLPAITGTVTISGTVPVTGPLTDTELRATPVPISGTVSANAGTNLNTSLLALESGGNLAALAGIVTAARAAVNPISGQSGVQGNTGIVTASTQRVVLATDVGLPTGANVIGHVIVDSGSVTIAPSGTQDVNLKQVGGTTFSLGQQLAAASLPIVLTAAQLTTLTPPAAITNYALETGGNLTTLAGIVSSARAAVNPISGQSGVQGNTGVVTALTQRVVLATDVGLPTGTNSIGKISDITTSITPGTGTDNLGKREYTTHSGYVGTDVGVLLIGKDLDDNKFKALTLGEDDGSGGWAPFLLARDVENNVWRRVSVDGGGQLFKYNGTIITDNIDTVETGFAHILPGTQLINAISMTVVQVGGTAISWTVILEISIDNANWTQIMAHTENDGNGVMIGMAQTYPFFYWRVNCTALDLGGADSINVFTAVSSK